MKTKDKRYQELVEANKKLRRENESLRVKAAFLEHRLEEETVRGETYEELCALILEREGYEHQGKA
jgi:regulator of replication initiation timing